MGAEGMLSPDSIKINETRLWGNLDTLSRFSKTSGEEGVTRPAWSKEFAEAQQWLIERFVEVGLEVDVDAAGNIWGKWAVGATPAIVLGSHIDSVPKGGRFDGCLGVLGGLEAVRALQEAGFVPTHQIWVVAWTEEEGSAFGSALFGSRAFVGQLDLDASQHLTNRDGDSLFSVVEAAGHEWGSLSSLEHGLAEVGAYFELHIEQGPMLEAQGIPIGIVTHIVGLEGGRAKMRGVANHAGGTPMHLRRDAVVGAAQAILATRDLAIERGVRATTGQISVEPGGSNVIAEIATFSLDARHHDSEVLTKYVADLADAWSHIGDVDGLQVEYVSVYSIDPVPLNDRLQEHLRQTCSVLSIDSIDMVSGAGHDAMVIAPRVPAAMVFVPSRGGVSHSPQEFSSPEDCAKGTWVLATAVANLQLGTLT